MINNPKTPAASILASAAPRDTLQEFVYRKVKDLILNGELAPGSTITIQALATAFAVSHMPVREALRRLTAQRALTVVAGRSMGIPALSLERLEDLRRVRSEVEGTAAAWAADAPQDAAARAALHRLHDALERAVVAGDSAAFLRANRALHFTIYAAAGSAVLLSVIESLWLQISPYFNLLHGSGNFVEANRQHHALILAMDRGDAKEARCAIQRDIAASTGALRPMLEAHSGEEST